MPILREIKSNFEVYENQVEGVLVAVKADNVKCIKDYHKKYKGKADKPNEYVQGHPFINDEEYDSLKIDFETTNRYPIKDLVRFK